MISEQQKRKGGDRLTIDFDPLSTAKGIGAMLANLHLLKEDAISKGDMDALVLVVDFEETVKDVHITPRQQQAIQYVFYEGMNQREAGELMGISQQAVQQLIHLATTRIAEEYRQKRGETIG